MILQSQLTFGNLTFDLRTAGDKNNELVIMLHGFPETNHMWVPLMEDLVKKGFYCVNIVHGLGLFRTQSSI